MSILATKTRRAEISKSRSKKKPFKVKWFAENGEAVGHHMLGSRAACITNITSMLNIFFVNNGGSVVVLDKSRSAVSAFLLHKDGRQVPIDVF